MARALGNSLSSFTRAAGVETDIYRRLPPGEKLALAMIFLGLRESFHALCRAMPSARPSATLRLVLPCLIGLGSACGPVGEEPLGRESEAINVCDETVPSNRYVDGLPAYAQCDATTASIWSNDGVDTAASSQGDGWVRTQQGGGYQCTEWAWRYMHFRWNIDYRHGDAREWCDGMLPATLVKSTTPVHGDLIVFDAGVCGADATTGHIAVIDTVNDAQAKVTLVEENQAGRRTSNESCALCFLHAVANDGTAVGAAGAGGRAAGAGGAPSDAGSSSGGATARGGASSFAGGVATGGMDSHAAGGAFSMAGHGAGGLAQGGSGGGATNEGGRRGGADGGAPNTGATTGAAGRDAASAAGVVGIGGSSGTLAAGGSAERAGSAGTATSGAAQADGDGRLPDMTNSSGSCQIGKRTPGGGAGWVLAWSYWLAARKRRFRGRKVRA
jgi:hypothetical protein